MKKTDPRVDAYIGKAAGFAKPILTHLRKLLREAGPEAEETMKWSMPSFVYRGKILGGMAAFKEHCTFGFWHQGMSAVLGGDAQKPDSAMRSFGRVTSVNDLPSDKKMALYIRKAAALNESDAPARPRPAKRPVAPLVAPEDLAAGLKKRKGGPPPRSRSSAPAIGRNTSIGSRRRNGTRRGRSASPRRSNGSRRESPETGNTRTAEPGEAPARTGLLLWGQLCDHVLFGSIIPQVMTDPSGVAKWHCAGGARDQSSSPRTRPRRALTRAR